MDEVTDLTPQMQALEAKAAEATAFLKKLANQDRLLIVCTLISGERSVRALEEGLGLRQPSLSQQLAELRQAGMIEGRKEGKQMFYRLADARVTQLVGTLYQIFCAPDLVPNPARGASPDASPATGPATAISLATGPAGSPAQGSAGRPSGPSARGAAGSPLADSKPVRPPV